jgi:hypothetical protein
MQDRRIILGKIAFLVKMRIFAEIIFLEMTQQYQVSVDNLSDSFLATLREHYPHAQLEIKVKTPKAFQGLNETSFWNIISLFDWSNPENNDVVVAKAIEILAEKPLRQIYEFQDLLAQKLFALDTMAHAKNAGDNAWISENDDFSADEFLYARCCVVANGQDFYNKVLKNPELMPQDLAFESLLTFVHRAYQLKTNKSFRYVPNINFETFSNKKGWKK